MDPDPLYIDIHTHSFYRDPEAILLLNIFPHEQEKLELPVYKSIGLHPWHIAENSWQSHFKIVETASEQKQVIAIGETGLDKKIAVNYDLQQQIFSAHISLSSKLNKPVIIHCVRSYSEMLALRNKSDQSVPWIFHWFNSEIAIARELIKKNCYLSFGHMLFNPGSKAFAAFPEIPPESLFFETDDAGFTISQVYDKAALLRNIDLVILKKQIIDNFGRCFHL
jgi:TatD DNase family protein